MYILKTSQRVSAELGTVFNFFSKPENLATITPSWLDFCILTPSPITMQTGALIDYEIKLGLLPTRWRTMITNYEPGRSFVDEQLSGPYSFWHHTHKFEAIPGGGTLLHDEIRYLLPLGFLGRWVHSLLIKKQLLRIFRHRHQVIAEKFGGSLMHCQGPEIFLGDALE